MVVHQAFLVAAGAAEAAPAAPSSWPVDGRVPDNAELGSLAMEVTGAASLTLDEAMAKAGHPEVQLIKMDVDGQELGVLEGGRSLLQRCRPAIVMELAPYVFHPPEKFDEMVTLLAGLGYWLRPLHSDTPLPRNPGALRACIPLRGSVNVVAIPGPKQ